MHSFDACQQRSKINFEIYATCTAYLYEPTMAIIACSLLLRHNIVGTLLRYSTYYTSFDSNYLTERTWLYILTRDTIEVKYRQCTN